MNHSLLMLALAATLGLAACEKPTVINVPPPAAGIPGPAGPTGATGNTGNTGSTGSQGNDGMKGNQGNQGSPGFDGNKGDTGKSGDGTTIIVVPAASSPSN